MPKLKIRAIGSTIISLVAESITEFLLTRKTKLCFTIIKNIIKKLVGNFQYYVCMKHFSASSCVSKSYMSLL